MNPQYRIALVDYDSELFDISQATYAAMKARLADLHAMLDIAQRRSEADVLQMAHDADLVMVQSVRKLLTAPVITSLERCRGIIRLGVGYDSVNVAAATGAGIPVSNVVDWCTDEVAEHTVALLLASARWIARLDRSVRAGEWSRELAAPITRVRGKVLGIIGFGRVAQAVAERMAGFGVSILVFDPYVVESVMTLHHAQKVMLEELISRADFITIHASLTEQTFHLLGAPQLASMKPDVIIVNTSRGQLIDEVALANALQSGCVRGAALDVMEQEPLPTDSPLRRLDNVILVPHIASYSKEAVESLYLNGAEIAAKMLSGQWVPTIVNPEVRTKAQARWGVFV